MHKLLLNRHSSIIRRQLGFTLVELLIVIAIIGVLSALLMANFIGVRQRARDSQRKADLRQIQSALELYRSDKSNYPKSDDIEYPASCNVALGAGSVTYMSKIPCDPSGSNVEYAYASGGTTYKLIACLENAADAQKDNDTVFGTSECSIASYTLTQP